MSDLAWPRHGLHTNDCIMIHVSDSVQLELFPGNLQSSSCDSWWTMEECFIDAIFDSISGKGSGDPDGGWVFTNM